MTIMQAISQTDELCRNGYSQRQKVIWLSRLESMVKKVVVDAYEGGDQIPFEGFHDDTSLDTVLMMPEPFDAGYLYWLEAQIHYANDEIDDYNRAMMMFTAVFDKYKSYYQQNHTPIRQGRFLF